VVTYHLCSQKQHARIIDSHGDQAQQHQSDNNMAGTGRRALQMNHDTHDGGGGGDTTCWCLLATKGDANPTTEKSKGGSRCFNSSTIHGFQRRRRLGICAMSLCANAAWSISSPDWTPREQMRRHLQQAVIQFREWTLSRGRGAFW
jgi:hypothetical protein